MFQDTVTVFNRRGDLWLPTVLTGVELQTDRGAIESRFGAQSADRALLLVPCGAGQLLAGAKTYLAPKAWQAQPDPAGTFTFTPGEAFDFFLAGFWPEETPIPDRQWSQGFFHHMNRSRDGVYTVSSVQVFRTIPHLEVMGI